MSTRRTTTTTAATAARARCPTARAAPCARARATSSTGSTRGARVSVNKAYKMFVGGAFVRSESGRYFQARGAAAEGSADPDGRQRPARLAQGRARRGARREERGRRVGRAHGVQPRADPLPPGRGDGVAPRRAARVARARRARRRRRPRARSSRRSTAPSTTRASATSSSRSWRRATRSRGRTSASACPSRWASSRSSRRSGRRCSGSCRRCCRSSRAATRASSSPGSDDPRTAIVWCECLATSDLPGGVVNVLTGQASEMAPHLAKHREVTAMDVWSADADLRAAAEREGSGNVKRVRTHDAAETATLPRRRGAGARLHRALPRDEDGLAPGRGVTRLRPVGAAFGGPSAAARWPLPA